MPRMLAVAVVLVCGCTKEDRSEVVSFSAVRFELGASVERSDGYAWRTASPEEREFATIEHAIPVSIRFPSGRSWETASRLTFLSRDQGLLSEVVVHPLEVATNYQEVVAKLRGAVLELGATRPEVEEKLDEWAISSPAWDRFARQSFRCPVEPGINLYAEVKPAADTDKWFLVLDFTVSKHFSSAMPDAAESGKLTAP